MLLINWASMFEIDQIAFEGIAPVSMQLQAGECVGLSGDSGCGKSRLLRAIADMDTHQGRARLHGEAETDMPASDWRRQVALLPAESQWWLDTVGQHFDTATADLSQLGFDEATFDWEISRCSSGEKQRLSILRSLANRPRVLLLDEPTANLDPENAIRVEALIRDYVAANAACCIWVSHNQLQLQRIASRRLQIIDGRVVEQP
jgi:ABC-type iron transport system FetAB ATPase subunit